MIRLDVIRGARAGGAARPERDGGAVVLLRLCLAVAVILALVVPQAHVHGPGGHSEGQCPTCTLLLAAGTVAILLLHQLCGRSALMIERLRPSADPGVLVCAAKPTPVAPRAPPAVPA